MSDAHYDCPCMEKCPLHHAMLLIGGKWKVQILVTRREYLEVPVRVEYSPTDSCRELLPILEQLSDWAEARM